jgi:DhnA family fructose-bisphosphate aldolase class Ia
MSIGKDLRLRRIIDPITNSSVMFAFSHGTSVPEVMAGLEDPAGSFRKVRDGGANCAFLTPGLLQTLSPIIAESPEVAIVAKITATATRGEKSHQERLIATVEHCATLGVDGVVALLPFAPENEADIITLTGSIGEKCREYGLPFIAEAEFPNAYFGDGKDYQSTWGLSYLKRSARLCVELGADVVKTNWLGSPEEFAPIVNCVSGTPVIVAGGSRESDLALLRKIKAAREVGAVGTSVGRNIFQHANPTAITAALVAVLTGQQTPEQAVESNPDLSADQVLTGAH